VTKINKNIHIERKKQKQQKQKETLTKKTQQKQRNCFVKKRNKTEGSNKIYLFLGRMMEAKNCFKHKLLNSKPILDFCSSILETLEF
jgi:hypothetical protein